MNHDKPLSPPLTAEEIACCEHVRRHVDILAGLIGERNVFVPSALEAAAAYIERCLGESGYAVGKQEYRAGEKAVRNVDATLSGDSRPDQIIVIGAHYDSCLHCPGANDNATGAAAVLEIARMLAGKRLTRTVRFAAFVNEEPPFFKTEYMGSRLYARRCRSQGEKIVAMLCPETIGCYCSDKGSQGYPIPMPFPLSLAYPNVGNFLAFVGNLRSLCLVRRCNALFRHHAHFPSRWVAAPQRITGIGWSDHWSFWQESYPAVMITDTAPYRYKHYHKPQDTPDRIDYERTARVIVGLGKVTAELAGGM